MRAAACLVAAAAAVMPAFAVEPRLVDQGVAIRAADESTTLDRDRGVLVSSVDLRVENTGDRTLEAPVHVAVRFLDALDGQPLEAGIVAMGGEALGGVGEGPYGTFWFELLAAGGVGGLAPGGELPVRLVFERARDVRVRYVAEVHAVVNRDPALVTGGPYASVVGEPIAFDAGESVDPDGDPVEVTWDFGDGEVVEGVRIERAFAQPGVFEVRVAARDGRGGESIRVLEVLVVPEGAFALARTRTVDAFGHPLGGVAITETGREGVRAFASGEGTGFASLGGLAGEHRWKFEAPGFLPVWRRAVLGEGEVAVVPSPWLAPADAVVAAISLVGETGVESADAGVGVRFGAGAFAQPGQVTLTGLSGQSLPWPLPSGWSPLAAFRYATSVPAGEAAAVTARLAGAVGATEGVAFVQFRESEFDWVVRTIEMPGVGAESVATQLAEPGTYAVVVADRGPTGPPAAGIGQALAAGPASVSLDGLVAEGVVDPPVAPASRVAEEVTGRAAVVIEGTSALASGEWFRTQLRERYRLRGGGEFPLPRFDATVFAYQRPGDDDANTLHGRFPMRPRLLLGGDELEEALLEADVLAPGGVPAGVLTPAGGVLATGPVVLTLPAGALDAVGVGELAALDPAGYQALTREGGGFPVVAAFRLGLPDLADGARLAVRFLRDFGAGADFVLARVAPMSRGFGLVPVERFRAGGDGVPVSVEPVAGDRLPGVTREGEYLLVRVDGPRGLVAGRTILDADGSPVTGAVARVLGEPWTEVSRAGGEFRLVGPAGASTVAAADAATGHAGTAAVAIDDPEEPVAVDVRLGPVGPSVVSVTPVPESTRVPLVTPIAVTFSEPIAPASFGAAGLALLDDTGEAVTGSLTLGIANLTATFLPANPLAAGTVHTIVVSDAVVDLQGLPLEGPRAFTFTTANQAERSAGAQLVIHEPGAENVPQEVLDQLVGYRPGEDMNFVVAHGSAGTADPEVPVILVNQTTGTTATVLSKPDGSFASFLEAAEEDFVEAVFVNANGTRVTVPATKQLFDDGAIGLYRYGGILEAESDGGPVEVIVEPEAIETRTRFRLEAVPLIEVLDLVRGVEPEGGKVLGGLRYDEEIEPIRAAADVRFPVRVADLDLPAGVDPEGVGFALTIPREIDGAIAYQVIDAMDFEPDGEGGGSLVTRSPPYVGLLLRQINAMREASGYQDTLNRAVTAGFGTASATFGNVSAFLVPILTAPVLPQTVGGRVIALPEGVSASADPGTPLSGAFVRIDVGIGAIEGNVAGLFRAGEMFSMSDAAGLFGVTLPTSFNRQLVATHPRFPFQRAVSTGIPAGDNAASTRLIFRIPSVGSIDIEDNAPPVVSVLQSPVKPGRGLGDDDGAVLTIEVADDLGIASIAVERHSFQNVTDSQAKPLDLLAEPELVASQDESGASGENAGEGESVAVARRLVRYRVRSEEVGRATYRIVATDSGGNVTERFHPVVYSTGTIGSDADVVRRLAFAWPPHGSVNVARGTPIRLRFSVPLTAEDLANANLITLHPPEAFGITEIEPSVDRREVVIRYFETATDPPDLTLGFDAGIFNQTPGGPGEGGGGDADPDGEEPAEMASTAPDYTIHFAQAGEASVEGELPVSAGGIVLSGRYAFAIDRTHAADSGRVLTYRLGASGDAVTWEQIGTTGIPGRVMAVEVVPDYSFRRFDGSVTAPANYLAVLAGFFDGVKRLHLFRIASDGTLEEGLFGSRPPVSIGISQVVKAKWDAPFLGLHELTPGSDNLKLINLNALFIGFELSNNDPGQIDQLPPNGSPGADLNNDGDFADPGETAPLPARRDAQVFGLEFSWAPLGGEKIRDFDFNADFGLLGGVFETPAGNGLVMVLGGGAVLDEVTARVTFPELPKRLLFLPRLSLRIGGQTDVRDVALVSTVDFGTGSSLIAIDVTDPPNPSILAHVPLPPAAGTTNTIVPRDDGLLAVSTTGAGVLLLDPRLLLETDPSGVTAALVGKVSGLTGGGLRSFVVDPSGLGLSAMGGGIQTSLGPPSIRVVRFDETPFDLASLLGGFVGAGGSVHEKIRNVVDRAEMIRTGKVFDPRTAASVFDRDAHHFVLVRAPGVLGESLPLAAAAIDGRGVPKLPSRRNITPTFLGEEVYTSRFVAMTAFNLFKTVKVNQAAATSILNTALSAVFSGFVEENDKPSYPADLVARRLSADEASPLFNTYLAGPIVVLDEDLAGATEIVDPETGETFSNQLDALQATADRRYLSAGYGFWVGLSPTLATNPLVGPWVGQQEEELFAEFNAGINLDTAFNLVGLGLALATGNPLAIVVEVSKFIDVRLQRFIHPGVNAFVFIGAQRNPLVFVHGVMASEMSNGNTTDFDLWVPILETVADILPGFDTAITDLVLPPPGSGEEPVAVFPTDVLRDVLGIVDIQGGFLDFLNYELDYGEYRWDYHEVNVAGTRLDGSPNWESLEKRPLLFPFPYDWRLDTKLAAERLAQYVELIRAVHPDAERVDIVGHSMGGLVSRRFVIDNPGVVENLVTVASPLLGATKAVASAKTGDLGEFALNFLVGIDNSRRIGRYMPALHQLMPSRGLFQLGHFPLVEDGWDLDGDGRSFGALDYEGYRAVLDGAHFYREKDPSMPETDLPPPVPIATNNEPFHDYKEPGNNIWDWRQDASDTRFFHIVAVQQMPRTISRVRLTPSPTAIETPADVGLAFPPVRFEDSEQVDSSDPILGASAVDLPLASGSHRLEVGLEIEAGAGDGTVPLLSQTRGYGAGATHDLNHPDAVLTAILSASTDDKDDKAASHVDVLHHPALFDNVGRILSGELRKADLPEIQVNASAAVEGQAMTFSATVVATSAPSDETPIVLWETGDGRTIRGALGVEQAHIYGDSGVYTLSCCVFYPEAKIGTVKSTRIEVGNEAPAEVAIVVSPESPEVGEIVTLTATFVDGGAHDEHTFEWTFGEASEPDAGIPPDAFAVRRSFFRAGEHEVSVTVTDDHGESGAGSTTFTVGGGGGAAPVLAGPQAVEAPAASEGGSQPTIGLPLEIVEIVLTGIDPEETEAAHDGDDLLGAGPSNLSVAAFVLEEQRSIVSEVLGTAVQTLEIFRLPVDPGDAPPSETTVTLVPTAAAVTIDVRYIPPAGSVPRCFHWRIPTPSSDSLTLTLSWAGLPALAEEALAGLVDGMPEVAKVVPCEAGSEPTVLVTLDNDGGAYTFDVVDATVPDGAAITEEDAVTTISVITTLPDGAPVDPTLPDDAPPSMAMLDGAIVEDYEAARLPAEGVPTAVAILERDNRRKEIVSTRETPEAARDGGISPEKIAETKDAIREAFVAGKGTAMFRKFVIDMTDVLVFEQGSGACLWKDTALTKCKAYVPGVSDNDYEIFLPAMKFGGALAGFVPDPSDPGMMAFFREFAHDEQMMEGSWYFKPPEGVDLAGRGMGPIPDYEDHQAYRRYVDRAVTWRYTLPFGVTGTLEGVVGGPIEIPKGLPVSFPVTPRPDDEDQDPDPLVATVFDNPATPAEIISFTLTKTLEAHRPRREILPDVSFFPFRREHFFFGVPSLEKPPPFGDDPLGDAGMGRGILFLKWAFEGAFLPAFDEFNAAIPDVAADQALRDTIFARLDQRREEGDFWPESFEWGLFHEFAMLRENARFRMRRVTEEGRPFRNVLPDYTKKYDDKILKKVGKGGIRAVAAKLFFDDLARADLFGITPSEFDANEELLTFEHWVAEVATSGDHDSLLGDLEREDVLDLLGAKQAEGGALARIRQRPGGIEAFIGKTFGFVRDRLQEETADPYVGFLEDLQIRGRVREWANRFTNVVAIDYGIREPHPSDPTEADVLRLAGREHLWGIMPGAKSKYSFIAALHRRGTSDSLGPFTVTLTSDAEGVGTLVCPDLEIPEGRETLVIDHETPDRKPFFTVTEPILAAGEGAAYSFTLTGGSAESDTIAGNNLAYFRSSHLPLGAPFFADEFEDSGDVRVVFRGFAITDAELASLRSEELSAGRLLAGSRRLTPERTDDEVVAEMAALLDGVVTPGNPFLSGPAGGLSWTVDDLGLGEMTPELKAALYHTAKTDFASVMISTSTTINVALNFAESNQGGFGDQQRFPYVLMLVVPRGEGIVYAPAAGAGGIGDPYPRWINHQEREILFKGELAFVEAHLFRITDFPGGVGTVTLRTLEHVASYPESDD